MTGYSRILIVASVTIAFLAPLFTTLLRSSHRSSDQFLSISSSPAVIALIVIVAILGAIGIIYAAITGARVQRHRRLQQNVPYIDAVRAYSDALAVEDSTTFAVPLHELEEINAVAKALADLHQKQVNWSAARELETAARKAVDHLENRRGVLPSVYRLDKGQAGFDQALYNIQSELETAKRTMDDRHAQVLQAREALNGSISSLREVLQGVSKALSEGHSVADITAVAPDVLSRL
jgi:hypothetical protein